MSRRAPGEGSVFLIADGRWRAKLVTRDALGKRRTLYRYGATQREARLRLADLRREVEAGRPQPAVSLTVGVLFDRWLAARVTGRLKPKTVRSYEQMVRVHLRPALGHLPLRALDTGHIRAMLDGLIAAGKAPRTAQIAHAVLRTALGWAVDERLLAENPTQRMTAPSVRRAEMQPLTRDEAGRLLTAVAGHRLAPLYRLTLATGLRAGEVLGLRWSDLTGRVVTIRQTISELGGTIQIGTPKSTRSHRSIPLAATVLRALDDHRAGQATEVRLAGARWREHGLIFPSTVGTPLRPRNLLRHFQTTCQAHGLTRPGQPSVTWPDGRRPFTFHALRHTAATFMLAEGVPLRVVMEILGHSQMSLTTDTYGHVAPELLADAADHMDRLLRGLDGELP